MRESTSYSDATSRSVYETGENITIPGQYLMSSTVRSEVQPSDRVKPTRYTAVSMIQRLPMLSGWNRQTVYAIHSGPMMSQVTHLDTGINPQSILRCRTIAGNSAVSNVKAQKVNLSMAFAQRKESLSLIKNGMLKTAQALSAIARKDWKALSRAIGESHHARRRNLKAREELLDQLRKSSKNVSSKYLATIFGLSPLISDVQGLIDEVVSDPRPLEFVATGRFKQVVEVSRAIQGPWIAWGTLPTYGPNRNYTTKSYASSRCFLRYRVDSKALQDMARLGLINPGYTLWDYLPWSFVIDWVVNIGQWLNTLDADAGLTFITGCYSEQIVHETTVVIDPFSLESTSGSPPVTKQVVSAGYTPGFKNSKTFERYPINAPISTVLQFKNPFSIFTAAASIALALQMQNIKRSIRPREFSYRAPRSKDLTPIRWVKP
jgi:hypothetical protein